MVNEAIVTDTSQGKRSDDHKLNGDDPDVIAPGCVVMETGNKLCRVCLQALPLPESVTQLLEENSALLKLLDQMRASVENNESGSQQPVLSQSSLDSLRAFRQRLSTGFNSAGPEWVGAVDQIWAFGPRRTGPNILLNRLPDYCRPSVWDSIQPADTPRDRLRNFDNSIVSGFQMATLAGPLCEEPLRGVAFLVQEWNMDTSLTSRLRTVSERSDHDQQRTVSEHSDHYQQRTVSECSDHDQLPCEEPGAESLLDLTGTSPVNCDNLQTVTGTSPLFGDNSEMSLPQAQPPLPQHSYGAFSGQLMSCIREACRKAFQSQPQRLLVAMYTCVIQATADVLGRYTQRNMVIQ